MTARVIVGDCSAPLAIDLYAGLGGWTEGLLAEGWSVIGFDIEQHVYGEHRYPAQLVLQDVRTLHGKQFKDAALIVASPPCQEFSYIAMPWTRAKQIAQALRGAGEFPEGYKGSRTLADLTALFNACFRIQREACQAAGRFIPLVVENVCGAQPWVGKARWHYGSYYLWGDVPALMPITRKATKVSGLAHGAFPDGGLAQGYIDAAKASSPDFDKVGGLDWNRFKKTGEVSQFNVAAERATKNSGGSWFNVAHNTTSGHGQNTDGRLVADGVKVGRSVNWRDHDKPGYTRPSFHASTNRKAASARIAKIPFALANYIAQVYRPAPLSVEETETP